MSADDRRVRQRSRSDDHVETFFDEVDGASRAEQLELNLRVALEKSLTAWDNLAGVLLQLFAVSRILGRLGVRAALYFLPVVAFAGYNLMLVAPLLALICIEKVAENGLDYSLQNTARQALYLVTSRAEKYVGKTAVDTFFVRLGDVFSEARVGRELDRALYVRPRRGQSRSHRRAERATPGVTPLRSVPL